MRKGVKEKIPLKIKLKYFFKLIKIQNKIYQIALSKQINPTQRKMDCPICMEKISGKANTLVTECGHCFHTKCMMTHVAHNGFGCPYCRAVMAEEPEYDDDESEYSDISEEENENDTAYILDLNEENRANDAGTAEYALRGMRLLFNRVEFDNECREEDDMEDQEPKPSVEFIVQKLTEQGVTFEQLVKVTLLEHDEYAYTREFDEYRTIFLEKLEF